MASFLAANTTHEELVSWKAPLTSWQEHTRTLVLILFLTLLFTRLFLQIAHKENLPLYNRKPIDIYGWRAALNFILDGPRIVADGYYKLSKSAFRIATPDYYMTVLASQEHINELRKVTESQISFVATQWEVFQLGYGLCLPPAERPINLEKGEMLHRKMTILCRTKLAAGRMAPFVNPVKDEVYATIENELGDTEGWKVLNGYDFVTKIAGRVSNRIFVGEKLCRNEEWSHLCKIYVKEMIKGGLLVSPFPVFLRYGIYKYCTGLFSTSKAAEKIAIPIIRERFTMDLAEKPNDFLQWLLDEDAPQGFTEEIGRSATQHMLLLNFGSLMSLVMALTQVLYDLAVYREHLEPLREEIQRVLDADGWSVEALGNMRLLDSFLKESQRMNTLDDITIKRKVLRKYTFKDGLTLEEGSYIGIPTGAVHSDPSIYRQPEKFDPYRFYSNGQDQSINDGSNKNSFTYASSKFFSFGHGQHVCPGRHLAVIEIKTVVIALITSYDFEIMGTPARRPENHCFKTIKPPNMKAELRFRKRR